MSAERPEKNKALSQPLAPAPMPEYQFQQTNHDLPTATYDFLSKDDEKKLDLSSVVFNFQ